MLGAWQGLSIPVFHEVTKSGVVPLDEIQQCLSYPLLYRFVLWAASAPGLIAMCFQRAIGERSDNLRGVSLSVTIGAAKHAAMEKHRKRRDVSPQPHRFGVADHMSRSIAAVAPCFLGYNGGRGWLSHRAPNSAPYEIHSQEAPRHCPTDNCVRLRSGVIFCVRGNWIMEIRDSYSDRRPAVHEAVGRASRGGFQATQPFEAW